MQVIHQQAMPGPGPGPGPGQAEVHPGPGMVNVPNRMMPGAPGQHCAVSSLQPPTGLFIPAAGLMPRGPVIPARIGIDASGLSNPSTNLGPQWANWQRAVGCRVESPSNDSITKSPRTSQREDGWLMRGTFIERTLQNAPLARAYGEFISRAVVLADAASVRGGPWKAPLVPPLRDVLGAVFDRQQLSIALGRLRRHAAASQW